MLGYVDDAILLPALIWLTVRLVPPAAMARHRDLADDLMRRSAGKPKSYVGAFAILAICAAGAWWASTAFRS